MDPPLRIAGPDEGNRPLVLASVCDGDDGQGLRAQPARPECARGVLASDLTALAASPLRFLADSLTSMRVLVGVRSTRPRQPSRGVPASQPAVRLNMHRRRPACHAYPALRTRRRRRHLQRGPAASRSPVRGQRALPRPERLSPALGSAAARAEADFAVTPHELIKERLQQPELVDLLKRYQGAGVRDDDDHEDSREAISPSHSSSVSAKYGIPRREAC